MIQLNPEQLTAATREINERIAAHHRRWALNDPPTLLEGQVEIALEVFRARVAAEQTEWQREFVASAVESGRRRMEVLQGLHTVDPVTVAERLREEDRPRRGSVRLNGDGTASFELKGVPVAFRITLDDDESNADRYYRGFNDGVEFVQSGEWQAAHDRADEDLSEAISPPADATEVVSAPAAGSGVETTKWDTHFVAGLTIKELAALADNAPDRADFGPEPLTEADRRWAVETAREKYRLPSDNSHTELDADDLDRQWEREGEEQAVAMEDQAIAEDRLYRDAVEALVGFDALPADDTSSTSRKGGQTSKGSETVAEFLANDQPQDTAGMPAISPRATATLGPEHTLVTPLIPRRPRTLAEVDADEDGDGDDADDDDGGTPKREMTPTRRAQLDRLKHKSALERDARGRAERVRAKDVTRADLIAELQRQAMAGTMRTIEQFDAARPALWPKAQMLLKQLDTTWADLAVAAGLKMTRHA